MVATNMLSKWIAACVNPSVLGNTTWKVNGAYDTALGGALISTAETIPADRTNSKTIPIVRTSKVFMFAMDHVNPFYKRFWDLF